MASIRRQVPAFVMMPERGWRTSCAIDAVSAPRVVIRATWASSERTVPSASSDVRCFVTSWTAPTYSWRPALSSIPRPTMWTYFTAPVGIISRHSKSRSFPSATCARAWSMSGKSSGCTRCRIRSIVIGVDGSYSKIRKVSSDQKCSSAATFQPKLPVRLNRWASARNASLRRNFNCAALLSVRSNTKATPSVGFPSRSAAPTKTGTRLPSFFTYSASKGRVLPVASNSSMRRSSFSSHSAGIRSFQRTSPDISSLLSYPTILPKAWFASRMRPSRFQMNTPMMLA